MHRLRIMRPLPAILALRAGSRRMPPRGKALNGRRVKVRIGLARAQIGLGKVRIARVRRIFSDPRERARAVLPAAVLPVGTSSMVPREPLVAAVRVLVVLRADTALRRHAPS
jgi:hypothetical protein